MNQTYKIPPRKWYTLEQAIKRIKQLTGEEYEINDLLHFSNLGYIELSVLFDINFGGESGEINSIDIRGIDNTIFTDEMYYMNIHHFSKNFENTRKSYLYNGNLIVTCEKVHNIIEKHKDDEKDDKKDNEKIFITSDLDIIKGFFTIELIDFENEILDENNFIICSRDIVFRFSRHTEIDTQDLNFEIRVIGKNLDELLYFDKNSFFILNEELEYFLKVGTPLRSLSSTNDFINEWENPTRDLKRYKDVQKTIEKTEQRIETPEIKKPIQYAKDYAKDLVIGSCLATRKDYPTAGKNTIVKAVLKKLTEDPTLKGIKFQSERTYTNILDRMEILFPDEKGKTIEISKVTIIPP
ncbi:hypothetical protein Q7471_03580 [Glaesserella parasuis]|nr:hypothetical protein [Glaesserella parasuis]MCT8813353.1 hypothetical protein [Glaesserella parasuis]MCT8844349.1 hypothetical protein [Glaesserella parasuis]MDE3979676.1 hypothetical protein [Glaesserella parasuis]MDO9955859.1 hypothetical protein [Glaesserella parasuis]